MWSDYLILEKNRIVAVEATEIVSGLTFSITPMATPYRTLHVVSVTGDSSAGLRTYDRLAIVEWRLSDHTGSIHLAVLLGQGDSPRVLSAAQKKIIRQWLIERSAFAYALASDDVRNALDDPEPFRKISEVARLTNVPLSTLNSAAEAGRLPALRSPSGGWIARVSAVKQRIGLPRKSK
jgi:hypothetical protein